MGAAHSSGPATSRTSCSALAVSGPRRALHRELGRCCGHFQDEEGGLARFPARPGTELAWARTLPIHLASPAPAAAMTELREQFAVRRAEVRPHTFF